MNKIPVSVRIWGNNLVAIDQNQISKQPKKRSRCVFCNGRYYGHSVSETCSIGCRQQLKEQQKNSKSFIPKPSPAPKSFEELRLEGHLKTSDKGALRSNGLRAHRILLGMSQYDLAHFLFCSQASICQMENGSRISVKTEELLQKLVVERGLKWTPLSCENED